MRITVGKLYNRECEYSLTCMSTSTVLPSWKTKGKICVYSTRGRVGRRPSWYTVRGPSWWGPSWQRAEAS